MKSLVVYYSKTGNTEKIAKAIALGLGADLKRVNEIKMEDIFNYDLICLGTPVQGLAPARPVKEFLDKLPLLSGKKGAAFCTMHRFGHQRALRIIKEKLEMKEISFIGSFSCKGLSRLVGYFGPKIFNKGKPNKKDLKEAENFGKKILQELKNT